MWFMFKNNMRQKSIAKTLTLWYGLFFMMVSSVVLFTIYRTSQNVIQQQEETQLKRAVDEFSTEYKQGRAIQNYENNVYLSVYDAEGMFVQGATPIGLQGIVFEHDRMRKIETSSGHFLYLDRYDEAARFWVRGAIAITNETRYMDTLLWTILGILPVLVVVILFVGYWLVKRTMAPIYRMSQTAKAITSDLDLSKRIVVSGSHNEINDLGRSFNAMLDAVEYSYEREKQFTADVSHELRTPLSVIVAESEYGKDISEGETKESFEVIERQSLQMRKTISQLLELERLNTKQEKNFEQFSFSELVQLMGSDLLLITQEAGIQLDIDVDTSVNYYGDSHLIRRLIDNLMSNALKYARSHIVLTLKQEGERIVLSVGNNGEAIEEKHLLKIFDRLYQVEDARNSQMSGNGFGLSYVKSIAVMHGGRVEVNSTPEWTCFKIIL